MRALAIVVVLVVAGLSASVACAQMSSSIPPGAAASNVRVVGYSEVDGRPPFKLSILERNGRWYLYAGHLWHRGWTVLDVTDVPRVWQPFNDRLGSASREPHR